MKRATWLQIVAVLDLPVCCCPNYRLLSKRYGVSEQALGSIYAQENQRRIIQSSSRLHDQLQEIAQRYLELSDFLGLCCLYNWPPCFLIRRLLEVEPWSLGRQSITKILRSPESVLDLEAPAGIDKDAWKQQKARVLVDIRTALLCDPSNSPAADFTRRETGIRYELQLAAQLGALGLAFWTEDALRARGFFKTPDAKLQVPFMYRGRVISWLDSKATFGGEYIHQQQAAEQYRKYVNRYGAGMVVYWFGLLDELAEADEDVILVAELPPEREILRLPLLRVTPLSGTAAALIDTAKT